MFRSYVWTYSVMGKPRHVWNKILSLLCHKFVNLWCLNVPCHEENSLLPLSSWPSFITQENKVKLQTTSFIAKLTVVAHFSSSAHLIIFSLSIFLPCYVCFSAVAQRLRYCATNKKVAGSIPGGVIGIFHWHNPSDLTMALGSTQPLTEMSTRSISWG
jgi:hypothetical protein